MQSLPHITPRNTMPPSENVRKFKAAFKDINFDTLKERHDNFSFEKTIEVRPIIYSTIHFKGGSMEPPEKQDIQIFPRKLNPIDSPNGGGTPREHHLSQTSFPRMNSQGMPVTSPDEERKLWADFKTHFRNPKRARLQQTHHDFVFNSQDDQGPLPSARSSRKFKIITSLQEDSVGSRYLSHDHKHRTQENYKRLQETAIPLPKKKIKDIGRLVTKARERYEQKNEQMMRRVLDQQKQFQTSSKHLSDFDL